MLSMSVSAVQVSDASIKSAQAALKLLPSIHYKTTKFLCSFLFRVSMVRSKCVLRHCILFVSFLSSQARSTK